MMRSTARALVNNTEPPTVASIIWWAAHLNIDDLGQNPHCVDWQLGKLKQNRSTMRWCEGRGIYVDWSYILHTDKLMWCVQCQFRIQGSKYTSTGPLFSFRNFTIVPGHQQPIKCHSLVFFQKSFWIQIFSSKFSQYTPENCWPCIQLFLFQW